jgi:hypothetical protein
MTSPRPATCRLHSWATYCLGGTAAWHSGGAAARQPSDQGPPPPNVVESRDVGPAGPLPWCSTRHRARPWRSQLGWHRSMISMILVALCRARCVGTAPR